jgi:hypothetical protein
MRALRKKHHWIRPGLGPSWKILVTAVAAVLAIILGLTRATDSRPEPVTFFGNDRIVASVVSVAPAATPVATASSFGGAAKLIALGTSLLGIAALLRRTS